MSSNIPTSASLQQKRGRPSTGNPSRRRIKLKKYLSFDSTTNEASNDGAGTSRETDQPTDFAPLLNADRSSIELNENEIDDLPDQIDSSLCSDSDVASDDEFADFSDDTDFDTDADKPEGNDQTFLWTLLGNNSIMTAEEAAHLLLSMQRRFRISDVAMDAFIKLINEFFKPAIKLAFKNFRACRNIVKAAAAKQNGDVTSAIKTICVSCSNPLDGRECKTIGCPKLEIRQTPSRYFTCSLEKQILGLVETHSKSILEFLEQSREVAARGMIADVTSGELYRSFGANPMNDVLTINLILNVDGARPLYASTGSLWPVNSVIVELPPKLRYSFENCIIWAMWLGLHKPDWRILLKEPLSELQRLGSVGILCKIGNIRRIKVRLFAVVCDLPARGSLLEHTQWNGAFGCMDCMDVGTRIGNSYVWPYAGQSPEKTSEWYQAAYRHLRTRPSACKEPFMGLKAESVLTKFIDLSKQNPLDFMHQAYRGVVDRILIALLTPVARSIRKEWNIGGIKPVMADLERLHLKIQFPHEFRRTVKPLERWKQSKAIEYKNMMLYTIVPLFKSFLVARGEAATNFWHWVVLYNEICRRLTQDEIAIAEIPKLEYLVDKWHQLVSIYLGESNATFNIHATRHMPKYVRLFGPVQNYSLFGFEGFNGLFVRLVSNAHGSMNQIADRLCIQQHCLRWAAQQKSNPNGTGNAISSLFESGPSFLSINQSMSVQDSVPLRTFDGPPLNPIGVRKAYSRARVNGIVLHSTDYKRKGETCSYIGKFNVDGRILRGEIIQFITIGDSVYVSLRLFNIDAENIVHDSEPTDPILKELWERSEYGNFFKVFSRTECIRLISLATFECKCIVISSGEFLCLTDIAHVYEHN